MGYRLPLRVRLRGAVCVSTMAIGRSSSGSMSTARMAAGGRRPAVVARVLDFGLLGLLVFGLWLPPQFFPQVASSDTTGQIYVRRSAFFV